MAEAAPRSPEAIAILNEYKRAFRGIVGQFVKPKVLDDPQKIVVLESAGPVLKHEGAIEILSNSNFGERAEFGEGYYAMGCIRACFLSRGVQLDLRVSGSKNVHTLVINFDTEKVAFRGRLPGRDCRVYNPSWADKNLSEQGWIRLLRETTDLLVEASKRPHKYFLAEIIS